MTELQQRVLDAIITEFKENRRIVRIHQFAKNLNLTGDEMAVVCKELVECDELEYIPCTRKTAPKNELVAPSTKHLG